MAHVLSPEAEIELDDIWYYIARESGNPDIAERFIHSLTERFYLLAQYPYIGRRRDDDLRSDMRSFSVGEYIILYRLEEGDIRILHVVRGTRNIQALFGS
jgi:toxin ParE1/3/4